MKAFSRPKPQMKPIPIPTKGKGFWKAIFLWVFGTRHWIVAKDFVYWMNGQQYVIPKGFQFDGASVPKFLAQFLSPVGVLLIGGLIHDYGYKYETLLLKSNRTIGKKTQKWMDQTFRDIFKFASLGSDDIFCHLGCGNGRGLLIAKEEFAAKNVIGIDNSKEKIDDAAKLWLEKDQTGVHLIVDDVLNTDSFYDANVILFWFVDEDIVQKMMKKFEKL